MGKHEFHWQHIECGEVLNILNAKKLITRSMSRKGNCWDNAVAESWFNRKRRHSALGYKTIEEFERNNYNFKNAA